MKPSEKCKAAGLAGLKELSKITEISVQTLIFWSKTRTKAFETLIVGAALTKLIDKLKSD